MTPNKLLLRAYDNLQTLRRASRTAEESLAKIAEAEMRLGIDIKGCILEAEERTEPPPIEVEMRLRCRGDGWYVWDCLLNKVWLTGFIAHCAHQDKERYLTRNAANAWLTALRNQLGVPLVAKWEEGTEAKTEAANMTEQKTEPKADEPKPLPKYAPATIPGVMQRLKASFSFDGVPDGFDDWAGVEADLTSLVQANSKAQARRDAEVIQQLLDDMHLGPVPVNAVRRALEDCQEAILKAAGLE